MILSAVVLVIACVWALTREESVAPGAVVASGLYVSMLGGAVGVAAGILALQDVTKSEEQVIEEEQQQTPPGP